MTNKFVSEQFTFNRLNDVFVAEISDLGLTGPLSDGIIIDNFAFKINSEISRDGDITEWRFSPADNNSHGYNAVIFND